MSKFDTLFESLMGGISRGKTLEDIAKKYDVSLEDVQKKIDAGKKVEKEHTDNEAEQENIAKDHIWEFLDYYEKLDKVGL
jgi:hypothetical protein